MRNLHLFWVLTGIVLAFRFYFTYEALVKKPTLFVEKCQISCSAFIFSTSGVCLYCDDGIFLLYCFYCPVCWPRWLHDRRIRASIRGANCCRCKLISYVPQRPVSLIFLNLLMYLKNFYVLNSLVLIQDVVSGWTNSFLESKLW